LGKCRMRCGLVVLVQRRAAEGAQRDASERVAVHVVRSLDGLQSGEAGGARRREIARAPQALPEITGGAGGRSGRTARLELDRLLETPAALARMAELDVRPAE